MTKKKHEPVLLPIDEGKVNTQNHNDDDPAFFSEDYSKEKIKPPYILIALMLFGILGAFWKMSVHKDSDPNAEYIAIQKKINDDRLKKKLFMESMRPDFKRP